MTDWKLEAETHKARAAAAEKERDRLRTELDRLRTELAAALEADTAEA